MTTTIRTFLALPIELSPELRTVLRRFREMGRAVKAVDSDHTHITLKFLGETDSDALPEIGNRLQALALEFPPLELNLSGIGAFPDWKRPQVAWVGVEQSAVLMEMAKRIEAALKPLGFPPEGRVFHPHLTLARIKAKPPDALWELATTHEKTPFGSQTVDRWIWYRSELQKHGPVYSPLKSMMLTG